MIFGGRLQFMAVTTAADDGDAHMFKSYWRRVHQRARRDARHALSLETKQRVVRLFLGTALSVAVIVFLASEAGYTTNLLSRIFLAFAALQSPPSCLLPFTSGTLSTLQYS